MVLARGASDAKPSATSEGTVLGEADGTIDAFEALPASAPSQLRDSLRRDMPARGFTPGKVYTVFSDRELRSLTENMRWLKLGRRASNSGTTRRMRPTTPYKRGDVVLVAFPFTDLTSSKRRPAPVISPDAFNTSNQDLVRAAITSRIGDESDSRPIHDKDFATRRLPKPSPIRFAKLFTFHSALIVKRIGTLSDKKIHEVLTVR